MTGISEGGRAPERAAPRLSRVRMWTFYTVLLAALLLLAAPMAPFLVIPVAWPFLAEQLGIHHLHDIGVATMLWLMTLGIIVQVRRPERQVGAMQQVLLVILTLTGLTALSRPDTLVGPLALAFGLVFAGAALHPARADVARVRLRADPFMAALAVLAAGPLLAYARGQLRLDHSGVPIAAHGGHWTAMAALAVSIVVLALLAATRPRGWRVPVWSAGGAAFLFGTASAVLPRLASSMGPTWGALTAAWGVAFVVTAEVRYRGLSIQAPLVPHPLPADAGSSVT